MPAATPPGGAPPWTDAALAQAGLLLLLDCDFERAFGVLERCPPAAFQPAQLLELFPAHARRWAGGGGGGGGPLPRRSYWGLHGAGPLPPLGRIVEDWLELQAATAPQHAQHAQQAAAPAVVGEMVAAGTAAVAAYLLRARARPGVALLAAVDTLVLQLLAEVNDGGALEAFVVQENAADGAEAAAALEGAGRWHALALLRAARGEGEAALRIWQVRGSCRVC